LFTEHQLNEFLIDFVYNSEAIEGLKASRDDVSDVIMNGCGSCLNRWTGQLRTHYYLALEVLNIIGFLHIGTIKSWHERLFKGVITDAGNFRTCEVGISGSDVVLPKSEFIYSLMCDFLTNCNETWESRNSKMHSEYDDYVQIGINHYRFERIHPFIDGNGRIGRLIMLHDLNRYGLDLKMITNINKNEYYGALSLDESIFGIWLSQQKLYTEVKSFSGYGAMD
jgi:Fic family protein